MRVLKAKRSAVSEMVIAGSSIKTGIKAGEFGCLRKEERVRAHAIRGDADQMVWDVARLAVDETLPEGLISFRTASSETDDKEVCVVGVREPTWGKAFIAASASERRGGHGWSSMSVEMTAPHAKREVQLLRDDALPHGPSAD